MLSEVEAWDLLPMTDNQKLFAIKSLHTAIWVFFNIVIFGMLYEVTFGRIDKWLWIGYSIIGAEVLTLLFFRLYCPLTVWARRYSNSQASNFDIFLPEWLAKYNKLIYSVVMLVIIGLTIYRMR